MFAMPGPLLAALQTPTCIYATCLDRLVPTFLLFLDKQAAVQWTFAYNTRQCTHSQSLKQLFSLTELLFFPPILSCFEDKNMFFCVFPAEISNSALVSPLCFLLLTVILSSLNENTRAAIQSHLPPSCPALSDALAPLCRLSQSQQPHADPAGAGGPIRQQALLLAAAFFVVVLLLRFLHPQLPAFPVQPSIPTLPTLPAALLSVPHPLPGGPLRALPFHGEPGGHGVPGHGASPNPLPHTPAPAAADNNELASREQQRAPSKQGARLR